jgi:hypothetical protein
METKYAYRYVAKLVYPDNVVLHLERHVITKETRCGFWYKPETFINWPDDAYPLRWSSNDGLRSKVKRSEKKALLHYIARTKKYISILERKKEIAERGFELAKEMEKERR